MITDLVTFRVKQDRAKDFERHNDEWVRLMRRSRGFVTQTLMRRIDRPGEYLASVRWVNRDFRDRFHAADDAERAALKQKAAEILEGAPTSVLLESC